MNKVYISVEQGGSIPNNGIIKVWSWKEKSYNIEYKSNKPIWEIIADSYQLFMLCIVGDTIEINEDWFLENFTEIK